MVVVVVIIVDPIWIGVVKRKERERETDKIQVFFDKFIDYFKLRFFLYQLFNYLIKNCLYSMNINN